MRSQSPSPSPFIQLLIVECSLLTAKSLPLLKYAAAATATAGSVVVIVVEIVDVEKRNLLHRRGSRILRRNNKAISSSSIFCSRWML